MSFRSRMKGVLFGAAAAVIALSLAGRAGATPPIKNFVALLNGTQEAPPNPTVTATGIAYLTYVDSTKMLCVYLTYSNLSSAETAAHVHGPGTVNVDAPIIFTLDPGNPKQQCFGPVSTTTKSNLLKNLLYINVHSANFTGGEIRGQILRIK